MRLICDNDSIFYRSSKTPADVHAALLRAGLREQPRSWPILRISAGYWYERYGTAPAGCKNAAPWYDSLFDPTDPQQVVQVVKTSITKAQALDPLDDIPGVTFDPSYSFKSFSNPEQEPTMSKPIEITTKTLVNGADIANFTDSQVYELIAAEEAKIAELDKIKTKPKKLVAEIEKRQAGIAALVAYLDSKE